MISITLSLMSLLTLPHKRIQQISTTWLLVSSLVVLPMLASQKTSNFWFFYDSLSTPLILLTLWISALMLLASDKIKKSGSPLFSKTISCLAAILVVVFFSKTLFCFYVSFEAALLPTLFLILTWGYQPERMQAGMYLMLYTVTASLPLLLASMMIHMETGTSSFTFPFWTLPLNYLHPIIWWIMMMTAFLAKMPMYSLHLWLPKAHVEAPVAGSMILAGVLLKLGGYGMLRVSQHIQFVSLDMFPIISSLALFGGIVCAIICLRQTDLKALIAYSSVTHMAMVVAAILSNSQWAWNGVLIMMLAHGLVSSALFALCNSCYSAVKTRSLFLTKGLMSFSPIMSFMWFFSLAANMGAPPSINLQSEIMMTMGILYSSMTLSALVAISLFLSAAYCLHVFVATQHGGLSSSVMNFTPLSERTLILTFLHIMPAFVLILKTEPFCCWC